MMDQNQLPQLRDVFGQLKAQALKVATRDLMGTITIPYSGTVHHCSHRYRFKCSLVIGISRDSHVGLPQLQEKLSDLESEVLRAAAPPPNGTGSLSVSHDFLVGHGECPYSLKALLEIGSPNGARPILAVEEYELSLG